MRRTDRSLLKAMVAIVRFSRLAADLLEDPRAAQVLDPERRRLLGQRYRQLQARARQLLPTVATMPWWPPRSGPEGRPSSPPGRRPQAPGGRRP